MLSGNEMKDCTNTNMAEANFQIERQQSGKNTRQRIWIYVWTYMLAQKESHKNSRILNFYPCTIYANTQTSIPFIVNKLLKFSNFHHYIKESWLLIKKSLNIEDSNSKAWKVSSNFKTKDLVTISFQSQGQTQQPPKPILTSTCKNFNVHEMHYPYKCKACRHSIVQQQVNVQTEKKCKMNMLYNTYTRNLR